MIFGCSINLCLQKCKNSHNYYTHVCTYHKQQKLNERKAFAVHWIISKCMENFCVLASSAIKVLKKATAQNICSENLCNL